MAVCVFSVWHCRLLGGDFIAQEELCVTGPCSHLPMLVSIGLDHPMGCSTSSRTDKTLLLLQDRTYSLTLILGSFNNEQKTLHGQPHPAVGSYRFLFYCQPFEINASAWETYFSIHLFGPSFVSLGVTSWRSNYIEAHLRESNFPSSGFPRSFCWCLGPLAFTHHFVFGQFLTSL